MLNGFFARITKKIKGLPISIDYRYPAGNKGKSTKILTDDIKFNLISPDGKFDFSKYSEAVVSIINGSDPKFCVGIYGEWGSGKTTLMRMIEKSLTPERFRWEDIPGNNSGCEVLIGYLKNNFDIDWIDNPSFTKSEDSKSISLTNQGGSESLTISLNRRLTTAYLKLNDRPIYQFLVRREDTGLSICENNILTVWFNAWRYENEKEFALIPLMKTIAYTIGDHPIYSDIKPLILKSLAVIGKDVLRFYATQYLMTEKGFDELEKNLKDKFDQAEEFDRDAIYFEGIKKIEEKMIDILGNKLHRNSRIVVFIDDLDRCSPEKALEVFESVKVFLDIKGFIFILGLSRETLDKLIVAKYEKMGLTGISGEEYIRKIIQIEIQIGKWKNESIGDLIDKISGDLDGKYRNAIENSKELIQEVVESNPRQAKRFINSLVVALTTNPQLDYGTFLVVEALQRKWKNFYDNLSDTVFLKEIKSGLELSPEERLNRITELEGKKDKAELSYDLRTIFADLKYCYLDNELWRFLKRFGSSILSEISPSEQPPSEREAKVAKNLETHKQASESSNIPIPGEYASNLPDPAIRHLNEILEMIPKYISMIEKNTGVIRYAPEDENLQGIKLEDLRFLCKDMQSFFSYTEDRFHEISKDSRYERIRFTIFDLKSLTAQILQLVELTSKAPKRTNAITKLVSLLESTKARLLEMQEITHDLRRREAHGLR
jgi:hypothetical protein